MNIAPTSTNGSFSKSSTSTISASTNNATGYTLSIAASSSNTNASKLINTSDSTSALNSITSATTEEQFKALSATTYNNMWGYLPSKYCSDGTNATCTTNTSFLPAPSVSGDILDQTSTANTTANNYTIAIGARIDSTTKTGSYANSFIVKLVANAIPYTMVFDDNVVSNMPTDRDTTTMTEQVAMPDNVPTRSGYKFLGWCTTIPTNNNGTDTCTGGTVYQPSSNLSINQTGSGNNFHFYAMWQELPYMQDLTASTIEDLLPNEHSTAIVRDKRDNQEYTIAKLKDGNYWMVENLNLAGGASLSAKDTDVTDEYITGYTEGYSRLTKSGNTLILPTSAVKNPGDNNLTDSTQFGTDNYSYVFNSGNKTNCGASGQSTPCYSYYSWDAATLGSGRNIAAENTDAPYSICPKGWRLPTSGNQSNNEWKRGDFYKLATAYGANLENNYFDNTSATGTRFYNNAGPGTTPDYLLASGYSGGSFIPGESGVYWSSTSYQYNTRTRLLGFTADYVVSSGDNYRRTGYSIRCLFSGQ